MQIFNMEKKQCYQYFLEKKNSGIKPIASSFQKAYPDLYQDLEAYLSDKQWVEDMLFSAKLYCYFNDIENQPKCKSCGGSTKFKQLSHGFFEFCSAKCSANYEETRKKCKETCLDKYGHSNVAHGTIKEKIKETLEKRYGGHHAKTKEYLKKKQFTEITRYGDVFLKTKKFKEKTKETCLVRYGVDSPMKCKEISAKAVSTKYERGVIIDWRKNPKLLEDFEGYRKMVYHYTEENFRKFYHEINPKKLKRSKYGWHLDHIYPIFEGWKNGIDPVHIANRKNLQMLWCKENHGKSARTNMTVADFYELIKNKKRKCK